MNNKRRQEINDEAAHIEYEQAAEWCALRGITGKIGGDPLPMLLSKTALDLINDDMEAFADRINDYSYALAMEKHADTGDNA